MAGSRRPGSPRRSRERRLAQAARRVLAWERARRTRVDITLLDAPAMQRLNRRATGRRRLTDVVSFTLPQPDGSVLGDIYICPAAAERWVRATRNAPRATGRGAVEAELVRLAVHGTLHVLGYDHPAGERRTRSAMWRRQERYVRRLAAGGLA
ncbi:MAG: rRNA maturation RNase YbeY [Gemmatimonadales bacterium]